MKYQASITKIGVNHTETGPERDSLDDAKMDLELWPGTEYPIRDYDRFVYSIEAEHMIPVYTV